MPRKPRLRVALIKCGTCGKRYSNPLAHVCVTSRSRSGRTRLAPKASIAIKCQRCGKDYANPLTHVCKVPSDFRKRKREHARQQAAEKRRAQRDQHDYATCDDEHCERFPCRVYREGYEQGYADGTGAGFAAGMAQGRARGIRGRSARRDSPTGRLPPRPPRNETAMITLHHILAAFVIALAYGLVCLAKPHRKCGRCKATGRSQRYLGLAGPAGVCRRCHGNKKHPRLGALGRPLVRVVGRGRAARAAPPRAPAGPRAAVHRSTAHGEPYSPPARRGTAAGTAAR